jgi:hypothetical protein
VKDISHRNFWILFFSVIIVAMLMIGIGTAYGRDNGQWTNSDPAIKAWFEKLMRPDFGYWGSSCCGNADAWWCDDITVKGNHTFCAITDDRDDGPLGRPHRAIGEIHEIPPNKIKFSETDPQYKERSNPTGHTLIFLASEGTVLCFVPNGGV